MLVSLTRVVRVYSTLPVKSAVTRRLADSYDKYNFLEIQDIIQNKSEQIGLPEKTADISEYENISGSEYYK